MAFRKNTGAAVLFAVWWLLAIAAAGQQEPAFETWRTGPTHAAIPWSTHISPVRLSAHQRLEIVLRIDSRDKENLEAVFELENERGNRTQVRAPELRGVVEQRAFVLPGKYTVSMALWNPKSDAYSFTKRTLHVPPLKRDPLPEIWTDLPPAEFAPLSGDSPESWFLPQLHGRLRVRVRSRHMLHVDLALDTHLTGRAATSVVESRRSLASLIPSFKALARIRMENGSIETSVLDPTPHRSVIESDAGTLVWDQLRAAIGIDRAITVNIANLHSESTPDRHLSGEIERMLGTGDDGRAVIVLSGSPPAPDLPMHSRLFYIQYVTPPLKQERVQHRPAGNLKGPPIGVFRFEAPGAIAGARIYRVQSPAEFREVIAAITRALATM